MCDHHPTDISRRGFAGLAALGAGLSLLPAEVLAGSAEADAPTFFCLMCIDYRFPGTGVNFFNGKAGVENYDLVSLAGAGLATFSPSKFPLETPALWEQLGAARTLHENIARVIVLDHMGCGAYKVEFGEMTRDREMEKHTEVANKIGPLFEAKGLRTDIWLLDDMNRQAQWIWPLENRKK
jgi:hypothetical protein